MESIANPEFHNYKQAALTGLGETGASMQVMQKRNPAKAGLRVHLKNTPKSFYYLL